METLLCTETGNYLARFLTSLSSRLLRIRIFSNNEFRVEGDEREFYFFFVKPTKLCRGEDTDLFNFNKTHSK